MKKYRADFSNIKYKKLDDFHVQVVDPNKKEPRRVKVETAYLVSNVQPDWLDLVVHRPWDRQESRGWNVSELQSGATVFFSPASSRDRSVELALTWLCKKGMLRVQKAMNDYRNGVRYAGDRKWQI